jgi:hypothetical protein
LAEKAQQRNHECLRDKCANGGEDHLLIMLRFIGRVLIVIFIGFLINCDSHKREIEEDIKIFYKTKCGGGAGHPCYDVYINNESYFKYNIFHYTSIAKSLNIKDSIYSVSLYTEWHDDYPETGCSDCCLIGYCVKYDSIFSYLITEDNVKGKYKNNLDWDKFIDCDNCIRTDHRNGYKTERIKK